LQTQERGTDELKEWEGKKKNEKIKAGIRVPRGCIDPLCKKVEQGRKCESWGTKASFEQKRKPMRKPAKEIPTQAPGENLEEGNAKEGERSRNIALIKGLKRGNSKKNAKSLSQRVERQHRSNTENWQEENTQRRAKHWKFRPAKRG